MRIGVLGTGTVGQTLAGKLAELSHDVAVGTRNTEASLARTDAPNPWTPTLASWHLSNPGVKVATFAEAAANAEIVLNATAGAGSLEALGAAGEDNLADKILVDISNPLDFSHGMPPTLSVANTDSLGEQIQRAFPRTKVVKTLNTVSAAVMINPVAVEGGDHTLFVSGDDAVAKAEVTRMLDEWFGWKSVIDLGDITSARGPEMYLILWLGLMGAGGSPMFNVKVVR